MVYFMIDFVNSGNGEFSINELSEEVVAEVFSHMTAIQIINCSAVSKKWNSVSNHNTSWSFIVNEFQVYGNVITTTKVKKHVELFFISSNYLLNNFKVQAYFSNRISELTPNMSILQKADEVKKCYYRWCTESSLHIEVLVQNSDNEETYKILDCLLNIGIDPNQRSHNFLSPIFSAVTVGDSKSIKRLIDAGASTTVAGINVFNYARTRKLAKLSEDQILELEKYAADKENTTKR